MNEVDLIGTAQRIAREAHAGQFRKYTPPDQSRIPYIEHPERVAANAIRIRMGTISVAAALLHDVIEDCDPRWRDEIAIHCGPEVFNLVYELTNPTKGMKAPRAVRKAIDREHLRHVSMNAVVLKLIDRTDNLNEMDLAKPDFKTLYLMESEQLLEVLEKRFFNHSGGPLHIADAEVVLIPEYRAALKKISGEK